MDVEIPTWLDDHSRYALHVSAHLRVTGPIVLTAFGETTRDHRTARVSGVGAHRQRPHSTTPATAYTARPKAVPSTDRSADAHDRVRTDKIDHVGTVTLRHNGRLHHIGVGRTYAGTYVRMLVHDLDITIVDAATGEILRELVLDPAKDYQGTGRPPGPAPRKTNNGPTFP
ncbi:hypothetical protein [Nocardioides humi]